MFRHLTTCLLLLFVLSGCGQTITITVPGGSGTESGYPRDGALPDGYERFLTNGSHNVRFSWPGEPVRRGLVAERFELRDGDCADSDCPAGRLRAELREVGRPSAQVGKDAWYGWSFYNDSMGAVSKAQSVGLVIGQWKLSGDQPPPLRIVQAATGSLNWAGCDPQICNPVGSDAEDVVAELEDMRVAANWGAAQNFGDVCRLFSMADSRGKWVDIVVNTNFAADGDGYLRIWVNGVMRCNYYGRIVASGRNGTPLNHRHGLFASFPKPWRTNQGGAPIPTMIAYYDEFRTGSERGDVDPAFRERAGLRPRD